jgi:hypothetical protein
LSQHRIDPGLGFLESRFDTAQCGIRCAALLAPLVCQLARGLADFLVALVGCSGECFELCAELF